MQAAPGTPCRVCVQENRCLMAFGHALINQDKCRGRQRAGIHYAPHKIMQGAVW